MIDKAQKIITFHETVKRSAEKSLLTGSDIFGSQQTLHIHL